MLGNVQQLKTLLPAAVLFAVCCLVPNAVRASGCHYGSSSDRVLTSGQPGVFAKDIWWAVGPVHCVYEYGQFTYYQIPTELLPCHGPGCRGKTPTDIVGQPVVVEVERQSMFGRIRGSSASPHMPPACSTLEAYSAPSSPVLGVLLRPPIAA